MFFGVRELCSVAERLLSKHDGHVPMASLVKEAVKSGFAQVGKGLRDLIFSKGFKEKFALVKRYVLRKHVL